MQQFNGIQLNNIEFTDGIPLNNSEFDGIPLQTTVNSMGLSFLITLNLEEFFSITLKLVNCLSMALDRVELNSIIQWDPIQLH